MRRSVRTPAAAFDRADAASAQCELALTQDHPQIRSADESGYLCRSEQTTLYDLVQQHAASFIAHPEASKGTELPRCIEDEFDAFAECGILAQGFLSLRCRECGLDKLPAFSCRRRGFCPSCGARRIAESLLDSGRGEPMSASEAMPSRDR